MPGSGPAKRGRGRVVEEDQLSTALAGKINANATGKDIQDEGTPLAEQQPTLNFIGAGVTAVNDGENTRTNVTIPGGAGIDGHVIQEEGSPLTQRPAMNFIGAGVTATDDGETTNVTIPGGGGGVVEKLFETTVVTPATTITASFTPINVVDYAEIWLIATGSISAQADIFTQINSLTSSSYGQLVTRLQGGGPVTSAVFNDNGSAGWHLGEEPILINTQFYQKIILQGGAAVASRHRGSIHTTYAGAGVGFDPSTTSGGIEVFGTLTTISQFVLLAGAANFNAGTKVSVFGVKTL